MRRWIFTLLLLTGPLTGSGLAAPAQASQQDAQLSQLQALRSELQKAEAAVQPLRAKKAQLENEAAQLAASIDADKRKPDGVRRDRELQAHLAESKTKTDEIESAQAQLRWREPGLTALRRRVIRSIDQVLDGKAVTEASRLELERLRTAQVALLVSPSLPLVIARDTKGLVDPLDGPRELGEKADLLRDSGDKLRREVKRLSARIDGVDRRRRLRERAGALDEDMFSESASNRRIARAGDGSGATTGTVTTVMSTSSGTKGSADSTGGSPVASPTSGVGAQGGFTGAPTTNSPSSARTDTTVLRNLVDPATLDELRQSDGIDDADRQTKALKKAQAELESLAAELDRRATALDGRAKDLKQQK
ncbi:MAG: hypothetical protein ABI321_19715 [Polyangia bacterium]